LTLGVYRPYHFIGLELGISVASATLRGEPTGSSFEFNADVAAVAKKDLNSGEILDGEGGYTVFGRLVRSTDSLKQASLPIGLTGNDRVAGPVAKEANLTYADVVLDETHLSYRLRRSMEKNMCPRL
jgi:predicted homoserine dehydrogenase-like protein